MALCPPDGLASLVVAPAPQRRFDVVLLSTFGAAAKENHQYLAVPSKIDSITRPPINPQFGGALTDRLHVGGVAISKAPDCDRHHRRRLRIEIVKPPLERAVAGVRNVFLNPNHMVPYTLLNSNPAQLVEHSAEAKL